MKKFGIFALITSIAVAILAFVLVLVPLPAGMGTALTITGIWLFAPAIVGSYIFLKMDKEDKWDLRKPLK